MIILQLSLIICSLFFFPSSLYIAFSLLLLSVISLSYLLLLSVISPLLCLLVVIVYAGAMMILIGYVSAVTPNIAISSPLSISLSYLLLLSVISTYLLSSNIFFPRYQSIFNLASWSEAIFFPWYYVSLFSLYCLTHFYYYYNLFL
jgi:hypothetical protein